MLPFLVMRFIKGIIRKIIINLIIIVFRKVSFLELWHYVYNSKQFKSIGIMWHAEIANCRYYYTIKSFPETSAKNAFKWNLWLTSNEERWKMNVLTILHLRQRDYTVNIKESETHLRGIFQFILLIVLQQTGTKCFL